jgi:hypothetical protein
MLGIAAWMAKHSINHPMGQRGFQAEPNSGSNRWAEPLDGDSNAFQT